MERDMLLHRSSLQAQCHNSGRGTPAPVVAPTRFCLSMLKALADGDARRRQQKYRQSPGLGYKTAGRVFAWQSKL